MVAHSLYDRRWQQDKTKKRGERQNVRRKKRTGNQEHGIHFGTDRSAGHPFAYTGCEYSSDAPKGD